MARYRGGDGHYADVECAYAELKRYLVLNALRLAVGSVAFAPPSPSREGHGSQLIFYRSLVMRTERFASHNEAREALVLSVVSVTAIMLIAYLLLLILY
jgi:hypothetical protein